MTENSSTDIIAPDFTGTIYSEPFVDPRSPLLFITVFEYENGECEDSYVTQYIPRIHQLS